MTYIRSLEGELSGEDICEIIKVSNNFITAVDPEVVKLHALSVGVFGKHFKELSRLIPNPVSFSKMVTLLLDFYDS